MDQWTKEISNDLLYHIIHALVMKLVIIFTLINSILALPLDNFDEDVFLGHEKEFDSSLEAGNNIKNAVLKMSHSMKILLVLVQFHENLNFEIFIR